jgi:hypothetical protein
MYDALLVHLVEELPICGRIRTRWMYFIKHSLKTLKGHVYNKAKLEGNMVEGYAFEKALGFCT